MLKVFFGVHVRERRLLCFLVVVFFLLSTDNIVSFVFFLHIFRPPGETPGGMNFVDPQMGRRMASRTLQEFNESIQVC